MDYGLTFDGGVALSQTGDYAQVFNNNVYLEAASSASSGSETYTIFFN